MFGSGYENCPEFEDEDILQKSKSIDGCLKYIFRNFLFMSTIQAFFSSLAFIFYISYITIIVDY
jgi:hypothetical protein